MLIALSTLTALTACQNMATKPALPYPVEELEKRLPALKHWQAEGKLAIRVADDRQKASFTWQQFDHNYTIHIFGPFGQGSTHIKRTSKDVTLENAELGLHRANSAEQLMREVLGWQVPVSSMQHWIKGLPAPRIPKAITRGENGLIRQIVQDGWVVDITAYQTVNRWHLPARIAAERGDVRLLVVIKDWQARTGGAWF